jgi:hypothetical protein
MDLSDVHQNKVDAAGGFLQQNTFIPGVGYHCWRGL